MKPCWCIPRERERERERENESVSVSGRRRSASVLSFLYLPFYPKSTEILPQLLHPRPAAEAMAGEHAEQQLQVTEIKEAFRLFDLNGDGRITMDELGKVMRLLGQVLTESELGEAIRQVDGNGNGTIEFEEFMSVMTHVANKPNNTWGLADEEEVRKAFCAFDKDQNGFISSEELFHVMKSLGEMPSKEEVQDMINQADIDGDGVINYPEFLNIMMRGNL